VADQAVARPSTPAAYSAPHAYHGRRSSWVVVAIIIGGFVIGGASMFAGPTWWLFWLGTGIVVLGTILGAVFHIFDDWY
jgi:hypothetical protein